MKILAGKITVNHVATVRVLFFKLIIGLGVCCFSAKVIIGAPELSTGPGQPIEYEQERGALVARGDAELRDGPILLRAEEIGFYQQEQRAEAIGNVDLTRLNFRLLGEQVDYSTEDRVFTAENFKAGQWPLFFQGRHLTAKPGEITFEDTTVYFGEPHPFSLRLRARKLVYKENGDLNANGARLNLGMLPLVSLPRFSGSVEQSPLRYTGSIGFRDNLGAYIRNEAMLQTGRGVYAGLNLDFYTERGILAGPALLYRRNADNWKMNGSLLTGAISDDGILGTDVLGFPVESDRSFLEWNHHQTAGPDFQMNAHLSLWSDSEVTRDFRPDIFYQNQNPDSFIEGIYKHGPFLTSVFTRLSPNEFQSIRERLPEIRIDMPAVPWMESGIWHRGSLQFVRFREEALIDATGNLIRGLSPETMDSDRFDFEYGVFYPIPIVEGVQFTPRLGTKLTHYRDTSDPSRNNYTRALGEFGFDLDIKAHATWELENPIWGVNGLRHLFHPIVQYRYVPETTDGMGTIIPIDRPVLSFNRYPVSLLDVRPIDSLSDRHFIRLGFRNSLLTRDRTHGVRELAVLNVYQDILLDKPAGANTWSSFWTEVELRPAPWLDFILFTRSDSEDQVLSELRGMLRIHDANRWSLSFGSEYLDDRFNQYLIEFSRRLSPVWHADIRLRWDQRLDELIEQEYGLAQRVGQSFLVRYALRVREGSSREDDIQLSLSFNFLGF